uniref:Uncharacterized protein n=1 Tax=Arundo donax TaxID=35708 RepID=A0A0A9B6H1_ARUDO
MKPISLDLSAVGIQLNLLLHVAPSDFI